MQAWAAGLLVLACATPYTGMPAARPEPTASAALIASAMREADLVVLGTPDSMVPEGMMAPGMQIGRQDAWFNFRITVEQVAKGKIGAAKAMDYGSLPAWLTPPRPFPLARNQIMVQSGSRWLTAPVIVGERAVYFLKLCHRCVEMPNRTQHSMQASPWLAILSLSPDLWESVVNP